MASPTGIGFEDDRPSTLIKHEIDADVPQLQVLCQPDRHPQHLIPARHFHSSDRLLRVGVQIDHPRFPHAAHGPAGVQFDARRAGALVQIGPPLRGMVGKRIMAIAGTPR